MSRAKTIELHTRKIETISKDKRKNVYTNGIDDNYPERIELIINNSVTAKMSANKMASFIVGKGFVDKSLNTEILNKKKNLTGYEILVMISNALTRQKGSTLHVNFNGMFEPDSLDVLPYKNCRKQKEDDIDNDGIIYYSTEWGNSKFSFNKKNKKSKWYYPFNSNEEVVKAQFIAEGITFDESAEDNVNTFRGQVLYLNLEPENVYPLAFIDPAYNDADSEYHSSIHRNNTIKNGFTDKQIIVAREDSEENENPVEDAIVDMIGSSGSNVALIEVPKDVDDLGKEIHVVELGGNVKAERYEYFDRENEGKILQCFENIPKALVLGNDTSLLGDGGKKLSELKLNYSQDVDYIRMAITQTLTKIFPKQNWEIEPLIKDESVVIPTENGEAPVEVLADAETLKAQAGLKGSVGGVQGILAIKDSFSEGNTDFESAITILVEIYGFDRQTAIDILGEIKTEEEKLIIEKEIAEDV
jgi:hypothetical protein